VCRNATVLEELRKVSLTKQEEKNFLEIMSYVKKQCLKFPKERGIYNKIAIYILNAFGQSEEEIAERLQLSITTVKAYKNELKKLNYMTEDGKSLIDAEHLTLDLIMLSLCIRGFVKVEVKEGVR